MCQKIHFHRPQPISQTFPEFNTFSTFVNGEVTYPYKEQAYKIFKTYKTDFPVIL